MLDGQQKKSAQAIVNIFETSKILGEYGQVTLLHGDTGHLTYGRSQTTLASGNLYLLVKSYCSSPGAAYGRELGTYLSRFEMPDLSLDHDVRLKEILRSAGDDPVMHSVQDQFFDRVYWEPTVRSAEYINAQSALGLAIIYDSRIHGSWHAIRDRTNEKYGGVPDLGEQTWFAHYVAERKAWLASHSNTGLRRTIYRMECFEELIGSGNWDLALPFLVRGISINDKSLSETQVPSPRAGTELERLLKLKSPYMDGPDVFALQEALVKSRHLVTADGIFGHDTDQAVRAYQETQNMIVDGIVGPATLAALTL